MGQFAKPLVTIALFAFFVKSLFAYSVLLMWQGHKELLFLYQKSPTPNGVGLWGQDKIDNCQQSYGLPSVINGLSHGLKIARPLSIFAPVCALVSPFQVRAQNQKSPTPNGVGLFWQGHKDLNPEPTVLETAALPIELYPYLVGLQGFEPGTIRL